MAKVANHGDQVAMHGGDRGFTGCQKSIPRHKESIPEGSGIYPEVANRIEQDWPHRFLKRDLKRLGGMMLAARDETGNFPVCDAKPVNSLAKQHLTAIAGRFQRLQHSKRREKGWDDSTEGPDREA